MSNENTQLDRELLMIEIIGKYSNLVEELAKNYEVNAKGIERINSALDSIKEKMTLLKTIQEETIATLRNLLNKQS